MRLTVLVSAVLASGLAAGPLRAENLQKQFDFLDRRAVGINLSSQETLAPSVRRATDVPAVRYGGTYSGPYLKLAREMASAHKVPQDLFVRLVEQESGWNPQAVSSKGAIGLGQLMPQTAARFGADPRDPRQNLSAAARYLRMQYDNFRDWRLALAAYNAGPDAVRKYGGVPPYAETQAYVVAILGP